MNRKSKVAVDIPILEWVFAAFGAMIVFGVIAFNVVQAVHDRQSPPDIQVEAGEPIASSRGFLVPIRAMNIGGESAASIVIEGLLGGESSEVTIDYVAPHSSKKAGLFFERKPAEDEVKLRVLGYQKP